MSLFAVDRESIGVCFFRCFPLCWSRVSSLVLRALITMHLRLFLQPLAKGMTYRYGGRIIHDSAARREAINRQYQLFREDMREINAESRSSRRQRIMTEEEEGLDYFAPATGPSERSEVAEDYEDEMMSVGDVDSIRVSEDDVNSQRHSLEYVSSESADDAPVVAAAGPVRSSAQREEARSFIDRVRRYYFIVSLFYLLFV